MYSRNIRSRLDSNQWLRAPKADTITTELKRSLSNAVIRYCIEIGKQPCLKEWSPVTKCYELLEGIWTVVFNGCMSAISQNEFKTKIYIYWPHESKRNSRLKRDDHSSNAVSVFSHWAGTLNSLGQGNSHENMSSLSEARAVYLQISLHLSTEHGLNPITFYYTITT